MMVGRWGMSDRIGLVAVLPRGGEGSTADTSEATRELVDAEVRRIVAEAYQLALSRLREHRDRLDALAQALLDRETLDEEDAYEAAGFGHQLADEAASAAADSAATSKASEETAPSAFYEDSAGRD
jgi:cell division protease FtsH